MALKFWPFYEIFIPDELSFQAADTTDLLEERLREREREREREKERGDAKYLQVQQS